MNEWSYFEWGLIFFGCWYVSGLMIFVHEVRREEDVTVGLFMLGLLLAFGGPFWLIWTIKRLLSSQKVLFPKYKKGCVRFDGWCLSGRNQPSEQGLRRFIAKACRLTPG